MASFRVKDAKDFSNGVFARTWYTVAEETDSAPLIEYTEIDAKNAV